MARQEELDWLKQYVSNNSRESVLKAAKARSNSKDEQDLLDFLDRVTTDDPSAMTSGPSTNKLELLHERAEKLDAEDKARVQRQQERDEQEEREKQQEQDQSIRASISRNVENVTSSIQPTIDRVGALPTLGGIGLLLGILTVLIFLVVRVNAQGDTRGKQLWYLFNGRAQLQGAVTPTGAFQGATPIPGGGAGGDFGSPVDNSNNGIINSTVDLGF